MLLILAPVQGSEFLLHIRIACETFFNVYFLSSRAED